MEGMEAARTPPEAKASKAASAHSSAVLEEVFAFAIPIGIDYTRRSGHIARRSRAGSAWSSCRGRDLRRRPVLWQRNARRAIAPPRLVNWQSDLHDPSPLHRVLRRDGAAVVADDLLHDGQAQAAAALAAGEERLEYVREVFMAEAGA